LSLYDVLEKSLAARHIGDPQTMDRAWLSTGLDRLHALIQEARRSGNTIRMKQLQDDPLVSGNLIPAIYYLKKSRARSPIQPSVHLLLGQLHAVSSVINADQPHLARARQLAPANAVTFFICGLMDLQADRLDDACRNLKKCLQIDPARYDLVVRVATRTLSPERIVAKVLPDDAFILFDFATNELVGESAQSLRIDTLQRAKSLLEEENQDDRKSLVVLSDIELELGNTEAALTILKRAVELNPELQQIRTKLVHLLVDLGQFDEALKQLVLIRRFGEDRSALKALQDKIVKMREESVFSQ
jgi:tetratricopeptide (TPR) repeat protein